MDYFYNEHYLLALSHDETVHGKSTIVGKMHGSYDDKFAQAKAMHLYMFAHPGKKLTFMGNEFAQLREWDESREQDWSLLQYPIHDAFHRFMRDINLVYLHNPALYERDYDRSGFAWLDCRGREGCVYVFERRSEHQRLVAVFNLGDKAETGCHINITHANNLTLLIDSNATIYGGNEHSEGSVTGVHHGQAVLDLERYSGRLYLVS
jgi:1,4-alpha-glucan branching enzyme